MLEALMANQRIILICLLPWPAGIAGCAAGDPTQPPERHQSDQVWAISCPDQMAARLHSDGTYSDGGGGYGRWLLKDKAIHIQVVKQPTVEFMSLYPEVISLDEDKTLPLVEQNVMEAELSGLKQIFNRCD